MPSFSHLTTFALGALVALTQKADAAKVLLAGDSTMAVTGGGSGTGTAGACHIANIASPPR